MSDGLSDALSGTYYGDRKIKFYQDRITNDYITSLKKNEIFVFGSNESGIHGGGAAKLSIKWGAEYGNPEGIQGNTYAIPTKDKSIFRTLEIKEIKPYVDSFIEYAKNNEDKTFLVTEIGCGLAGLTPEQVAPLFKNVVHIENVNLPQKFWNIITNL